MTTTQGCMEWMEPARAKGVHELMESLLGRCTCEGPVARVYELYGVNGARTAETLPQESQTG